MDSYPTYEEFPATGPEPGRVSGLLLTNEPPSATERDQLLSITRIAPRILDDLDHKIAYLQTQRDQIASYHRHARTILHPIRLVPDDVLYRIFAFTREASLRLDPRPYTANTSEGLWPASQVCQQWRTLIIQTPRFWSFIRVNLDSHTQRQLSRVSFLLSRVLGRARAQDLQVELESTEDFVDTPMETVFYTLLSTASQWTSLKLMIPTPSFETLNQGEGMFTRLRSLAIFSSYGADFVDVGAFRLANNLRSVSINRAEIGSLSNSGIALPRGSIERLSLLHATALGHHVDAALSDYSNLDHLEVVCSNAQPSVSLPTIYHGRISHLTLYEPGDGIGAGGIELWLDYLDLPQLRTLRIVFSAKPRNHYIFLPMLLRRTRILSVETIEIFCVLPQQNPLILGTFLESCPHSLRTLRLRMTNLRSADLQRLSDKTLVPQLQCLDLRGSTTDGSPLQQLRAIVQSRRGTMQQLRLNSAPPIGQSRWNEVEEQVEVRYGPRIEQFDGKIPLPEDD